MTATATNGKVTRRSTSSARFGAFQMLPVGELHTDGTYQRPVSEWRVRDIIENYEPILFQPLIIGKRDGVLYVVDGQHRLAAALALGFKEVPCMLYATESVNDEARAFVWLQQNRRRITPTQTFIARIAYEDVAAVSIAKLLKRYDFEIGDYDKFSMNSKNNRISAISSIEKIYNQGGSKRVDDLLYVLRNAWDGRASALTREVIKGLGRFFDENPYSRDTLAKRLADISPWDLETAARSVSHARGLDPKDAMGAVIGNIYRGLPARARAKTAIK